MGREEGRGLRFARAAEFFFLSFFPVCLRGLVVPLEDVFELVALFVVL